MADDLNIKKKRSEALRFLGKGKIDKAIEVYEDILKVKEDPDIYNSVGDLYVRKQNISRAIEAYEKAFKLYKDIEFLDNAVAVIRKILKYEKDRKDLYLELADLYTELGNQDAALDALESVITEDLDPSMLERAFAIITQLAEKVQEDESSVRRFERLFIKLQEISERFGEISLESGMGMDMGMGDEDIFASEPSQEESVEEEGLVLEDTGEEVETGVSEAQTEGPSTPSDLSESHDEGFILEEEGKEETAEVESATQETEEPAVFVEEEEIRPVSGLKKYDDIYEAPEASTEDLVFEAEEPEEEPAISDFQEPQEEEISELETKEDEFTPESGEEIIEGAVETEEPVISEPPEVTTETGEQKVKTTDKGKTMPTEEIIATKPVERQKPPTTTKHPEIESKYYEEFKDIVLTFIEEMGEANIDELYDFEHPFETAMTLYRMDLFDAAIDEFQLAMRDSEYRLRAMEMIGRIFFELNNYEMAIKMLEKALDEGGYEEHEYVGIRYYLGKAYEAMGLEDKALEHYEQLYLIDRNYRDVSERIDALRLKRVKSF